MIADWRTQWGEGDFPFLFVQIANFKSMPAKTGPNCESSSSNPLAANTAMAVTIDIGDLTTCIPTEQGLTSVMQPGPRRARRQLYGEQDRVLRTYSSTQANAEQGIDLGVRSSTNAVRGLRL